MGVLLIRIKLQISNQIPNFVAMFKNSVSLLVSFGKKSIGFLLFLVCAVAIYNKVLANENWAQYGEKISQQCSTISLLQWIVLLLLMLMNFLIEAIKWKYVVARNNPISILQSLKSIFVGQSFAFFTPNRIGEYAGRTLFLQDGNKMMGMAQMAWTSYAQLLITIILGSIALMINLPFYPWLQWASPLLGIVATFLFFYRKEWKGWAGNFTILQIPTIIKLKLLGLSFIRYTVFMLQYLWAAHLLGMPIPVIGLVASIAVLFLCLSILPTISITELVIRGQLLLIILAPYYTIKIMIISLSTLIWAVNFLLPAIIGAFLLIGYRLKK
jgi:hypothetical protein